MAGTGPKISIVSGSQVGMDAIVAFALSIYGRHAHQAMPGFYRWLYELNPNCNNGLDHLLVAVEDKGQVVGFVNRLFLTWEVEGIPTVIPAIGDLALAKAHRKGGAGLRLVLSCTRGTDHAFVNGSNPNSSPLFRSLKYQELGGASWFRLFLHPVRAAWGYALHRSMGVGRRPPALERLQASAPFQSTTSPVLAQLEALAGLLNGHPSTVKPLWTPETLAWRFFHPMGPRHVLIHSSDMSAAMVLSAGTHHGVTVCRPIAYRIDGSASLQDMLKASFDLAHRGGIDACMAFTFDHEEATAMNAVGMRKQALSPGTFFHHRRSGDAARFARAWVQGAASDLGFDAFQQA